MNTDTFKEARIKAIRKARDLVGGTAALARITGVKSPTVCQWINGERPVPVDRCLDIETALNGLMTRVEIRPDKDWNHLARVYSQHSNQATEVA